MKKIMKWLGIDELINRKNKIREERKREELWKKEEDEGLIYIS